MRPLHGHNCDEFDLFFYSLVIILNVNPELGKHNVLFRESLGLPVDVREGSVMFRLAYIEADHLVLWHGIGCFLLVDWKERKTQWIILGEVSSPCSSRCAQL